jgi:hypothetical protein
LNQRGGGLGGPTGDEPPLPLIVLDETPPYQPADQA